MENLNEIRLSVNLDELKDIFMGASALIPSYGFENIVRLTESIVDPANWAALNVQIGLAKFINR